MKIMYDDSKKKIIDSSLEESFNALQDALRYADSIYIPGDFNRANDISVCLSTLRSAKELVSQTQTWITKNHNGFVGKAEATKTRVSSINNVKITKKSLLVK